jgi:hypothetical protein
MKRIGFLVALFAIVTSATAATTSGVVFSNSGEPLAGAKVTARRAEGTDERRSRIAAGLEQAALATSTTNADGVFTFDTKASGVIELVAENMGYAPTAERVLSGETGIVLNLTSAPTRSGRITAGGKPVNGALVMAASRDTIIWSTRSDERGMYAIPDPAEWSTGLVVVHSDYAPFSLTKETTRIPLDVALEPGRTVKGMVVGPSGRPEAAARVVAGPWQEVVTGEDGTFTLAHVAAPAKSIAARKGPLSGTASARDKDIVIKLETGRTITGTVRDASKRPLAGALVWAYKSGGEQDGSIGTFVRTDDKGSYEIANCVASQYGVYAFGTADVTFEPGQAPLRTAKSSRIDFTAKPMSFLRGIVIDERSRPVGGATVQWIIAQTPVLYGYLSRSESASTLSGMDGRFRLPLPMDDMRAVSYEVRLQALRTGHAIGTTEPLKMTGAASQKVTVKLPDGIAVSGTVRDSDGVPVKGAGVVLVQDPWGAATMPMDSVLATNTVKPFVVSDAEGNFTVHLNGTTHDLGVWKEGYAGFRQGGLIPQAGAPPLKAVLERGVEIRGRVTRKGSRVPFTGTIVARGEDTSFATTPVAADGTFTLSALHHGKYTVSFSGERGDDVQRVVEAPATDVVLELSEVGEIAGHVVDEATGQPIDDFAFSTQNDQGHHLSPESGSDGLFKLQVPAGSVKVSVRADGYLSETASVVVEVGKTKEITISLVSSRTVSGRVLSETGQPVSGASIAIESGDWQSADSDDNGDFSLAGVPRERATLKAEKSGFVSRSIDVEASASDARVDIILSRGKKATGRVTTSTGALVDGATVWMYSDGESQQALTGADGTFIVEGLSRDRYSFRVSKEDVGSAELSEVDIAKEVLITLKGVEGWGAVHGRVAGFKDGGWMYGSVSAEPGNADAPIGRDGTYRLARVPAGEVKLSATAMTLHGDASTSAVEVTIPIDGDIVADLAFRTDITVRGVVTEGGKPVSARRVRFSGRTASSSTTTGEDGAYALSALEPGMYDVSVDTRGEGFETHLQVRDSTVFDIRIDATSIAGRIIDETGAPLTGVKLEAAAIDSTSNTAEGESDATGAFSLRVFRQPYVLTATKKGYATAVQRIEPDSSAILMKMVRADGLRIRLVDARDGHSLDGYVVATDPAGMKVARVSELQSDGSIVVPLAGGSYRISASSNGFATQSVRVSVPDKREVRLDLTPGGTLVVRTDRNSSDVVKLVQPGGEEYVRCECNGITAIRLTGTSTVIEHIAPGTYTMNVLDEQGRIQSSHPVTIIEGQTATVEIHLPG